MPKRLFDLLCAGAGLVLLAPLLLGIALWIKIDTPGPVFFRQQRVGRFGALFRIHKFRSMRADAAQSGPQITVGADPRITRAGHFLRRTKLDELPQLLDVLAGTMSLVGPRLPPALEAQAEQVGRVPGDRDHNAVDQQRQRPAVRAHAGECAIQAVPDGGRGRGGHRCGARRFSAPTGCAAWRRSGAGRCATTCARRTSRRSATWPA